MAYRIDVKGKYGSRNGSYLIDFAPKGYPDRFIREQMNIIKRECTADQYTFRILDLDREEEYKGILNEQNNNDDHCSIVFEEPWIFYHCSIEEMMNNILEYLKEGNWDFAEIYDNKLFALPLQQKISLCYPLHVPQKPIIERQKIFKILRAAAPIILADMFGLNNKEIEVYPINQKFDPDHWSWQIQQARRLAKEEGSTLKELFS